MDVDANSSVLVTGGRGFIGRALVKLLQREGYRVISLDTSAIVPGRDCESVRELACDIGNASELQRAFETERVGGIIHLAAILPTAARRDPLRATRVNVDGSVHLLEMALHFGVRRFVFGSSLSVYGTRPADQVVSESDRAAPEDLYGAAKAYIEQLGQAYGKKYGVDFVSLRIGRVVGPGSESTTSAWRSQIFEVLRSNKRFEIALPFVGSERLLLVHVDDVARTLTTLLGSSQPTHIVYNAPCESVIVGDLKREVEALNENVTVKLGETAAAGNPRLLDFHRFQQEFSFQATSIIEGLKECRFRSILSS